MKPVSVPGFRCDFGDFESTRAREVKHHLRTFHKIERDYNRFIRNVVLVRRRRKTSVERFPKDRRRASGNGRYPL